MIYESVNIPLWRALKALNGRKILDVGCGTGALGELLSKNGNAVDGITYSEDEARIARERIASVRVMDLNDASAVATIGRDYDVLIFADVLEHLLNPRATLVALLPRLKAAGGFVYVSLPNIACFYTRLGLFFGRFNMSKTGGILDETHLHFYTLKSARAFLADAGLKIEKIDFVPAPVVWVYQTFVKKHDAAAQANAKMSERGSFQFYERWIYPVEHLFSRLWRPLFANQFVFVCVRAE